MKSFSHSDSIADDDRKRKQSESKNFWSKKRAMTKIYDQGEISRFAFAMKN
jgi:hypothetical protein